jgi:hypothetical protein
VSPVRYELGFCIPEDGNLHSQYRENLKSYIPSDSLLITIIQLTLPTSGGMLLSLRRRRFELSLSSVTATLYTGLENCFITSGVKIKKKLELSL